MRGAILVQERADLWMALTEDRREYIRDPNSTSPFPQLAGWPSADAARAVLERWGYLVLSPPERRYIVLKD